jgi:hypothetical protein
VAERVLGVSFHVSINPFDFLPMCAIRPRSCPTDQDLPRGSLLPKGLGAEALREAGKRTACGNSCEEGIGKLPEGFHLIGGRGLGVFMRIPSAG